MASAVTSSKPLMLLGKCVASYMSKCVRVIVDRMEIDNRYHMFFKEKYEYFAHDPENLSKPGDIVLIKLLSKPISLKVDYKIEKVVYKFGEVVDPLTGRKCAAREFIDDIEQKSALLGSRLKYKKAEKSQPKEEAISS